MVCHPQHLSNRYPAIELMELHGSPAFEQGLLSRWVSPSVFEPQGYPAFEYLYIFTKGERSGPLSASPL